jgi:hypothetical protein
MGPIYALFPREVAEGRRAKPIFFARAVMKRLQAETVELGALLPEILDKAFKEEL